MFIRTVGLWFSWRVSLALVGWLHGKRNYFILFNFGEKFEKAWC